VIEPGLWGSDLVAGRLLRRPKFIAGRQATKPVAGGALIGGFTGHVWYPGTGPMFDGLFVVPAVLGALVGAVLLELIYRRVLRPKQS
jgi:cytochrome c biogenesis protein CcdA